MKKQMQEMQDKAKRQLALIRADATSADGMVSVTATGDKRIANISIKPELLAAADAEQLEDLLLATANRALEKAEAQAASKMQELMAGVLPPGFLG